MTRSNARRLLAATAAAALALTACGSDDTSTSEPTEGASQPSGDGEATTLTVISFLSPEQFQPLKDAWEAERPDVTIDYQPVPFGDLNAVVQSRVGGGDDSVDVIWVDEPRTASFASQGMLLDLSDHVEVDPAVIDPSFLTPAEFDGGLYTLPIQTSTHLFFYNPDLLAAAGVDEPSTNPAERWTWEDAVAAAEAAQDAGARWGVVFEQGATPYQLLPLPESLGGGPGLTGDDLLEPDLTNDAWVEAMTFFADLHEREVTPRGMGFGETTATFAAGDAAFVVAGPWNLPIFDGQDLPFEYGVAPVPTFADGEDVTPTGSFTVGVNAASQNVDAAVDFVEFVALSETGNAALTEGDPNIPAHAAVRAEYLSSDTFQRGNGGTVADLIQHEITETARSRPVTIGWVQFEEVLGNALEDIRNGQDVVTTLESAEDELRSILERLR